MTKAHYGSIVATEYGIDDVSAACLVELLLCCVGMEGVIELECLLAIWSFDADSLFIEEDAGRVSKAELNGDQWPHSKGHLDWFVMLSLHKDSK